MGILLVVNLSHEWLEIVPLLLLLNEKCPWKFKPVERGGGLAPSPSPHQDVFRAIFDR
jgi:hypothetical protein